MNISAPSVITNGEPRQIVSGSWKGTIAGGLFKILIAALALSLPMIEDRPLPLWVGGMLVAGGLAELAVGWSARKSIIGRIALGSGTMTALAGLFFMAVLGMGLARLTILTMVWLVVRGLVSLRLALQSAQSGPVRTLLLVRAATDLILGFALIAGLSILQIAILIFGSTSAMAAGFFVIIAISFGVAGGGLVVVGLLQRTQARNAS